VRATSQSRSRTRVRARSPRRARFVDQLRRVGLLVGAGRQSAAVETADRDRRQAGGACRQGGRRAAAMVRGGFDLVAERSQAVGVAQRDEPAVADPPARPSRAAGRDLIRRAGSTGPAFRVALATTFWPQRASRARAPSSGDTRTSRSGLGDGSRRARRPASERPVVRHPFPDPGRRTPRAWSSSPEAASGVDDRSRVFR